MEAPVLGLRKQRTVADFVAWLDGLDATGKDNVAKFLFISRQQGQPWLDAFKSLLDYFIAHGPEIMALIMQIIKMFGG